MRPLPIFARSLVTLALALAATAARAQLPSTEEQLKVFTNPESVKKKVQDDKARPPLEIFRAQVAPFDILPYAKPNHWFTLGLEMRANHDDYNGTLQTVPIPLLGMPQEIVNRRDARLVKTQRSRLSLQMMLPRVPKEMGLELVRPDAIRADEVYQVNFRVLEAHQMLVVILAKEANDAYAPWAKLQAFNPASADRTDPNEYERQRYFRLVLPLETDKPMLSAHPLTWTAISHVLWDGMPPDRLNVAQQQALIDWIHWGGQLVLAGGSAASYETLRESFLSPYLPAESSGANSLLKQDDLGPLSESYPPPNITPVEDALETNISEEQARLLARRYKSKEPIIPASNRPLFVAGLRPTGPTAVSVPLGEGSPHLLGIEARVGRGRILMLTVNPTDPALAAWPGLDTLIRRVVLRRPEEQKTGKAHIDYQGLHLATYAPLSGPDLSWFRFLSRDLGAGGVRPAPYSGSSPPEDAAPRINLSRQGLPVTTPTEARAPGPPVAEWLDSSGLPKVSRTLLEKASGISVPSASFVLKVILAYLIAIVPLNWLICRYVFGRREWAWAVVPVLSLAFAIGVERAAAFDMGYDLACDEIDVVETFNGYPRAHLSRFASLYSTGRVKFTIAFPDDPTAIALPLDTGHSLQGEDVSTAVWQSYPVPMLAGYQVQPRSLGMFRAEQMPDLSGSIALATDDGPRRIVNNTELELRDAVLVDVSGSDSRKETYLGTIAPGATLEIKGLPRPDPAALASETINPALVLKELRQYYEARPENSGELRLVAWSPRPMPGVKLQPAADRHRGFTAVVVHLGYAPPPAPDGLVYNSLAKGQGADPDAVEVRGQPSDLDDEAVAAALNALRAKGFRGYRMPGMQIPGVTTPGSTPTPMPPDLPDPSTPEAPKKDDP